MNPKQASTGTSTWHCPLSHPPHLGCADEMEFPPSLHKLGISFQLFLFLY